MRRIPLSLVLFPCIVLSSLVATAALATEPGGNLARVGSWPFGVSYGVDFDPGRNLVFLGSGGAVLVIDASDPGDLHLVSDTIHTTGFVKDVSYDTADQEVLLACDEGGLEIWDVSDPAHPQWLSTTEVLDYGYETPVGHVEEYGDVALVECVSSVRSLDISDPAHPVEVDTSGGVGSTVYDIHVSSDGMLHTTGYEGYARHSIAPDGTLSGAGSAYFLYGAFAVFGTPDYAYLDYGGYLTVLELGPPIFNIVSATDLGGIGDIFVLLSRCGSGSATTT